MAKKKKYEKINEIVTYDGDGNITRQKLTGNTGGYTRETTPALSAVSQTIKPTVKESYSPLVTVGKTLGNVATNMGTGALKNLEGVADFVSDKVTNPTEQKLNYVYDYITKGKKTANENLADLIKMQERDIKKNRTEEFLKKTGYSDIADEWEKGSLVKSGNFAGKVTQGVGGMVPSLVMGGALGGEAALTDLSKLSGKEKALAALGNVGKTYAAQLPANVMLGASSYGSGMEEALNEGATMDQARKFGLANMAIEQGTEMLTGGVPGLGGKGGIDSFVDPLIDKNTKGLTKAALKTLYRAGGEGLEESAAALLNPLAKKIYSDEKINWKDVGRQALEEGLVGAATGAILSGPQTAFDFQQANLERHRNTVQNLNDVQREALIEVTNKRKQGIPLDQNDYAVIGAINNMVDAQRNQNFEENLQLQNTINPTLQESANQYGYKGDAEQLANVQTMLDNRGIQSRFDSSMFTDNDTNALWMVDENGNRQVVFNPNANENDIIEEVAVHELAHDIMSSENSKMALKSEDVLDFVKTLDGYEQARLDLEDTYSQVYDKNSPEFQSLIDEEVVADFLGKRLGNQEYVTQLTNSNPNFAKKIYNWVVEKLNSIVNSGGNVRSERLYWQNIKNNFEKAYNMEYQNNSESNIKSSINTTKDNQELDNSSFSMDNNGRKLTNYTLEKTKNSQARDENGNLLLMYHGSPNGDYQQLRAGTYFTPNKEYAQRYLNPGASSITSADTKKTSNPKVYEAYLNIENPFDISNPKIKDIYINEYIKGKNALGINPYLSDSEYNKINEIDWTEAENLQEFLEENHPEFDGLVLNEGGDGGYGAEVIDRGKSYIPFNEDQIIKANDNNTKYSISKKTGKLQDSNGKDVKLDTSTTGTTGTLMAIHNLNQEKLSGILELGGFPYPSIAITKPGNISHEGYGDISVLFDKSTINPETNTKNKVYSRDAYTPRFPSLEYKIDSNQRKRINSVIGDYDYRNAQPGDSYISDARSIMDNLEDNINRSGLEKTIEDAKNNPAMKYVYLKNTDPSFKVETKNETYSSKYDNETLQKFLDNYNGNFDYNNISSNEVDNYLDNMVKAYEEQLTKKYKADGVPQDKIDALVKWGTNNLKERFSDKDNFLLAAHKLQKYGAEKQTLDSQATQEKMNNVINEEDYNKWVDNLFENIIEKKGLRNNKDYYTASGTPRSFEQLHDEYTLDNVVKIMDSLNATGSEGGMMTGVGEIAGNASVRFNNINDIKANENLLTTVGSEKYSDMLDKFSDRLFDIGTDILDRGHNNSDNQFIARDNLNNAIADAARIFGEGKKIDANKVSKILNEYGFNPTNQESQKILDIYGELRQLPTQYFEAKPQRAVGLDEVQAIVIPNNTDSSFKKQLQDQGLTYYEYDPNIEGDRNRVINQFDDLKFKKQSEGWEDFLDRNVKSEGTKTRLKDIKMPLAEVGKEKGTRNSSFNNENRINNHTIEYKGYYIMSPKPNVGYNYKSIENSNYLSIYDANNDDITHNVANWVNSVDDAKEYIDTMVELNNEKNIPAVKEDSSYLTVDNEGNSKMSNEIPKVLDKISTQENDIHLSDVLDAGMQRLVNKGHNVDKVAKQTGNNRIRTSYDRVLAVKQEAQNQIGKSQTNLLGKEYKNFKVKNKDGKIENKSLSVNGIYEDAAKSGIPSNVLDEYAVNKLNLDRRASNNESWIEQFPNMTEEYSQNVISDIERLYPEIKRVHGNLTQFYANLRNNMEYSGILSKDSQEYYDMNTPNYVRIQRAGKRNGSASSTQSKSGVKINNQQQKIKGGNMDILPIRETTAQFTIDTLSSMRKNIVAKELAKVISPETSLENATIEFGDNKPFSGEIATKNKNGEYQLTYFENGEAKTIPIDSGIYYAMTNPQISKGTKLIEEVNQKYGAGLISRAQRGLLTDKNAFFILTNFFKDIGDAPLNSKYTKSFVKNYPGMWIDLAQGGPYSSLWKNSGGEASSYFKDGRFVGESTATNIVGKAIEKVGKGVEKALTPIEIGNNFIEQLPRLTEFKSTIEANGYEVTADGDIVPQKGKNPTKSVDEVLDEAMYNSAEITTNFKRGGTWTKAANRNGATFLNASVQGFDKFIRNFTDVIDTTTGKPRIDSKAAVKLMLKATLFGIAPSMINDIMNGDDDDYEDIPEYQKDSYYLFKLDNHKWLRIPKGRMTSIFGSAARRTKNLVKGDTKAFDGFIQQAQNQVAPNNPLTDNAFAGFYAVKNNKSWSGNPIVSTWDENPEHPEDEYDSKTDEFSKWLGKKLHKSPKKINYVLDQYTGVIGDIILPLATKYTNTPMDNKAAQAFLSPLQNKFTTNDIMSNKSQSEFYDAYTKAQNEVSHNKKNNLEKPEDNAVKSYLTNRNKEMSEIKSEIEKVQASNMSNSEKIKKVQEYQNQINTIAKDALKDVVDAKENEYYMQIGDYYYKRVVRDGKDTYERDTSKNIPTEKYALYDYYKEKYEKSKR